MAFKLALQLVRAIYGVTRTFPRHELYGLTSQLRRAGISIISNIAEGCGRATAGEFRNFVSQARGSLFEVEAQLIVAEAIGYLTEEELRALDPLVRRCGSALLGLLNWLKEREAASSSSPRNHETPKPRNPETPIS